MIIGKLKKLVEVDELVFQTIDILKNKCIYYEFIPINEEAKEELYMYTEYFSAIANQVDYQGFQKQQENLDFEKEFRYYFDYRLPQKIYQKQKTRKIYKYINIILAGIYILYEQGFLISTIQGIRFQRDYSVDLQNQIKENIERFRSIIKSNWMKTWQQIYIIYLRIKKEFKEKQRFLI